MLLAPLYETAVFGKSTDSSGSSSSSSMHIGACMCAGSHSCAALVHTRSDAYSFAICKVYDLETVMRYMQPSAENGTAYAT